MRLIPWLMPPWACSGTEPPGSSSDAVDVTVQGQMLWTVEDAREEVNFPRRFSPLASPEPPVVSARASVSPCRGCFRRCELRVPARVCPLLQLRACRSLQTRHLEMGPEVCMISLQAQPRSLRGLCSGDRGVWAAGGRAVLSPHLPPLLSHQVFLPRLQFASSFPHVRAATLGCRGGSLILCPSRLLNVF